jgi:hypothetical protein
LQVLTVRVQVNQWVYVNYHHIFWIYLESARENGPDQARILIRTGIEQWATAIEQDTSCVPN